jgi:ABC-type methionine transport system ATPase subunit
MTSRVKLIFPENLVREPLISRMVRAFDVDVNIRRASVEETFGWIVCEIDGDRHAVDAAISWLDEAGVEVEPLGDVVES